VQIAATQPRRGTILALALLAACAFAVFAHGAVRIPDESWLQAGLDVAALAAAAAWLSNRAAPRGSAAGWAGAALLACFAVWCAITILWSVAPDESWLEANRALAYALVVVLAIGAGARVQQVALGWLVVATAVALYALAGKVAPGAFAADEPIARLRAPLQYWNALALVCAMGLPVALRVATDRDRSDRVRLGALAAAHVLALTMGLTYSRGGFVALAVALIVMTALGGARLRGLPAFALAAVAAVPGLAVAFTLNGLTENDATLGRRIHDGRILGAVLLLALGALLAAGWYALRFERRYRRGWRIRRIERWAWRGLAALGAAVVLGGGAYLVADHTRVWHSFTRVKEDRVYDPARLVSTNSGNRWVWWKEAAGAFSDKPVGGWGAGSFEIVHLRYRSVPLGVRQPHNVELQWLSETGIVGFLLAFGAIAALFVAAGGRVKAMPAGRERDLAVALLAAAAGWLVHGVVDWDWDIPGVTLPPLIFLGVLAARPGAPPRRSEPFADLQERGTGARVLAVVVAALLLCGALASAALPALSQSRTDAAETATNPDTAARDADVAARLNPLAVLPLIDAAAIEVRRGRLVEARSRLLEAAGRQPDNPEVWYRLALLSQQLADRAGFRAAIARFAQLDPVNPVTGALERQAIVLQAPPNGSATATATPLPAGP
jgi:hypothetical protein